MVTYMLQEGSFYYEYIHGFAKKLVHHVYIRGGRRWVYYEYIHGLARRSQSTLVTHMMEGDGYYYEYIHILT